MRLTAAQGWPLSWTENPEWISFCDDFIPQAKNPTRKVITSRLLPAEVKSWRDKAQAACTADPKQPDHVDKLATVTCDGFTPRNQHHIVAFMITVTGQVRPRSYRYRGLSLTCDLGLRRQGVRYV